MTALRKISQHVECDEWSQDEIEDLCQHAGNARKQRSRRAEERLQNILQPGRQLIGENGTEVVGGNSIPLQQADNIAVPQRRTPIRNDRRHGIEHAFKLCDRNRENEEHRKHNAGDKEEKQDEGSQPSGHAPSFEDIDQGGQDVRKDERHDKRRQNGRHFVEEPQPEQNGGQPHQISGKDVLPERKQEKKNVSQDEEGRKDRLDRIDQHQEQQHTPNQEHDFDPSEGREH